MKTSKIILLINPPLYFSKGIPFSIDNSVPPLGLLYLASYINKLNQDFKAEIIDVSVEGLSVKQINRVIRNKNPFAIGITSMTAQLQGAVELASEIKNEFKNLNLFLGGPHVSADPDFINRFNNIFDYAICGEAEKTLLKSLEELSLGRKIPKIQKGEVIKNLNTIPFPDRNLLGKNKYNKTQSMIFSRGCPYNCYYCSRPSISKISRYRTVDNLLKEIDSIFPDRKGSIDFQDDTFTLSEKTVVELCESLSKRKYNLRWRCNTRIDLVNKKLLFLMAKAGCSTINFGIESGSEKLRKETIHKGVFSNKRILGVRKWCREDGIQFCGYFIIGHYNESKKDLEQTKKLISSLKMDLLGLSLPIPFPGSELYQIAEKEKVISNEIIDKFARKEIGEGYGGIYPIYISKKLDKEEVYKLMGKINKDFYLNFRTIVKYLKEDISSFKKLKSDIIDLVSIIIKGMSSRKPYLSNK